MSAPVEAVRETERGGRLTVAAVIPCHNGAAYLGEAIASVRAQSRPVQEIVVVDDASTDDSARVAAEAGVRCLRLAERCGPAAARNAGARATSADLLAFLDADDVWLPDHVDTVASLLERSTAGVAYAHTRTFPVATAHAPRGGTDGVPFDAVVPLLNWNFVPQSAAVVRRDAFWAVGGYDEGGALPLAEDYELWLRLAERVQFVGSPHVTSLYRLHEAQSSRDMRAITTYTWIVRDRYYRTRAAGDRARRAALRRQLVRVWLAELRQAWRAADRGLFTIRVDCAPWVPMGALAHRWVPALARLAWAVTRRG